jgi:4-hydroxybenzoyl-CoA reductase subunit beta
VIAGGTDVLPNMKQGLVEPEHVVSIGAIEELRGISLESSSNGVDRLVVGAGMRLSEIADSSIVQRWAPALAQAAGQVGGPHHRSMGTLGGNVCLDTRCRYYNQTYLGLKSLGFCLKKDGSVCHLVRGGQKCLAAASNDTAPALLALEGDIHLLGPSGSRVVAVSDFYTADGIKNTVLEPGELVVRVSIPRRAARRSAFEKLRRRGAIDFPLLSVAARVDFSAHDPQHVEAVDVVVSALGARPRRVRAATMVRPGTSIETLVRDVSRGAFTECKPLSNVDEDTEWRREMVPQLVERALRRVTEA